MSLDEFLKKLKWIVLIVLFIITVFKIDGWFYWSICLLGILIVIFFVHAFWLRKLPKCRNGRIPDFNIYDIRGKKFKRSLFGFAADEVGAFLDMIIQDYERLGLGEEEAQFRSSAHDIHSKKFRRSLIGYDVDEVNDYLDRIIKKYEELGRV